MQGRDVILLELLPVGVVITGQRLHLGAMLLRLGRQLGEPLVLGRLQLLAVAVVRASAISSWCFFADSLASRV